MNNRIAHPSLYTTSLQIATKLRHEIITADHIVAAMLNLEEYVTIFKECNTHVEEALDALGYYMESAYSKSQAILATDENFNLIKNKLSEHHSDYQTNFNALDLIVFMFEHPTIQHTTAIKLLKIAGFDVEKLQKLKNSNSYIDQFGINLSELAKVGKLDKVIGRETETLQIVLSLLRKRKNNVILTGPAGVGKSAIAEGLALAINNGNVPEDFKNKRVFSLDLSAVIAGTKFRGEFEDRMKKIIDELIKKEDTILFIDEIHQLMGMNNGENSAMNAAQILKPALARGQLKCIGATDTESYRKILEKDKPLMRRFQQVEINEPNSEDTKKILRGLKESFEQYHNVKYSVASLDSAVELSGRYITNKYWPDKAIDLIDAAGARAKLKDKTKISVEDIEFELTQITKVKPQSTNKEQTNIFDLSNNIKTRIFEQDKAIETLVDSIAIARCGMRDLNKPLGRYLFVGPSGTGKTEVCRELAKELNVPLLKYDMSEFMEQHSVSKLIGSPPGYVGYADGNIGSGKLINDIENNPNAVLLLDEIEKAHPSIFNIFLQVLDDAKLTSSDGKTVNFNNIIIVMTSNAGATLAEKNAIGFNSSNNHMETNVLSAVEKTFTPEFRNRLDEIVVFNRLSEKAISLVANKFLDKLNEQLSEHKNKFVYTPEVVAFLAEKGYNPKMGARPMERAITDYIKKPISRKLFELKQFENVNLQLSCVENQINVEVV